MGILPEVIAIEATEVEVITIDDEEQGIIIDGEEEEVAIICLYHSVNFQFQEGGGGLEQVLEEEAPDCPICYDTVNIGDEVKSTKP